MKGYIAVAVAAVSFLFCMTAHGTVLNQTEVKAKKVTLLFAEGIDLPAAADGRMVFTERGFNRIGGLRVIDIVVDREGRTEGVRLLYEDKTGLKSLYLRKIKALLIEEHKKGPVRKGLTIRTITADELSRPW